MIFTDEEKDTIIKEVVSPCGKIYAFHKYYILPSSSKATFCITEKFANGQHSPMSYNANAFFEWLSKRPQGNTDDFVDETICVGDMLDELITDNEKSSRFNPDELGELIRWRKNIRDKATTPGQIDICFCVESHMQDHNAVVELIIRRTMEDAEIPDVKCQTFVEAMTLVEKWFPCDKERVAKFWHDWRDKADTRTRPLRHRKLTAMLQATVDEERKLIDEVRVYYPDPSKIKYPSK